MDDDVDDDVFAASVESDVSDEELRGDGIPASS